MYREFCSISTTRVKIWEILVFYKANWNPGPTLPIYTVNTRKFDLNELKEIVVCGWQFFVDNLLLARIVEARHLETE